MGEAGDSAAAGGDATGKDEEGGHGATTADAELTCAAPMKGKEEEEEVVLADEGRG